MIYILITIAAGTFLTRAFPFLYFRKRSVNPKFIRMIDALPFATISLLVVYSLKDVGAHNLWPTLVSSLVCVLTYIWKKSAILSIALSTILYMLLI